MKELLSTTDPVLLSMVSHYLGDADIVYHVFDGYMGGLFPGVENMGANRVMVDDDDFSRAKRLLKELEIDHDDA